MASLTTTIAYPGLPAGTVLTQSGAAGHYYAPDGKTWFAASRAETEFAVKEATEQTIFMPQLDGTIATAKIVQSTIPLSKVPLPAGAFLTLKDAQDAGKLAPAKVA